jgi:hypothetical protein
LIGPRRSRLLSDWPFDNVLAAATAVGMAVRQHIRCPYCSTSLKVAERLLGKVARCRKCRKTFELTMEGEARATHDATPGEEPTFEEAGAAWETAPELAQEKSEANGNANGNSARGSIRPERSSRAAIGGLGRFELCEVLGQGSFGRVYKAYDPQLDRFVALKVPTFGSDQLHKVQRFLAEAKAAARLRHPNIVPTYESGELEGQFYIAAQFVDGEPLAERIEGEPVEFRQAAEWVAQLAEALAYAHREGIVHRDIKPGNVMLDRQSVPQIMDFGLAKRIDEDSAITTDGSVLGTPAYMPPEQARGELGKVGPHSDQYSLGVVLYELLSGQRPFEGPPHAVIAQVVGVEPPSPRSVRVEIPKDLEAICQKAMSKEIAGRYGSTEAMAGDLRAWLRGDSTLARPMSAGEQAVRWMRRNPVVTGLTAAVTLVTVLGLVGVSAALWQVSLARTEAVKNAKAAEAARIESDRHRQQAEENLALAKARETEAETAREEAQKQATAATEALAKLKGEADARQQAEKIAVTASKDLKAAEESAKQAADEQKKAEVAAAEAVKREQLMSANRDIAAYQAQLQRAMELLSLSQKEKTLELLDECRDEYRSWEWHYLRHLAVNPVGGEFTPKPGKTKDEVRLAFFDFLTDDEVVVVVQDRLNSQLVRTSRATILDVEDLPKWGAIDIHRSKTAFTVAHENLTVLRSNKLILGTRGDDLVSTEIETGHSSVVLAVPTDDDVARRGVRNWIAEVDSHPYLISRVATNLSTMRAYPSKDFRVTTTLIDLLNPRLSTIVDSQVGRSETYGAANLKADGVAMLDKGAQVSVGENLLLFVYPAVCVCHDLPSGKLLFKIAIPSNVQFVSAGAGGRYWCGIADQTRLYVFNTQSGEAESPSAHRDWLSKALPRQVSFDQKRLLWHGNLYDLDSGLQVYSLHSATSKTTIRNRVAVGVATVVVQQPSVFSPSGNRIRFGGKVYSMGRGPEQGIQAAGGPSKGTN